MNTETETETERQQSEAIKSVKRCNLLKEKEISKELNDYFVCGYVKLLTAIPLDDCNVRVSVLPVSAACSDPEFVDESASFKEPRLWARKREVPYRHGGHQVVCSKSPDKGDMLNN